MKVGVVGASVAGAYFAHLAVRRGIEVHLFDPRVPWDKPCGGGLTGKAMTALAAVPTIARDAEAVTEFSLIAPSGGRAEFTTTDPLFLLPRFDLGEALVRAACDAGATLVSEKVRRVTRETNGSWSLHTGNDEYRGYDHLVGADGATSAVRRFVDRPFARDDLILALDYHIETPNLRPRVALQFLGEGMGYLWLFAGRRYASAGIGLPAGDAPSLAVHDALRAFLAAECPVAVDGAHARRWVIPYHRKGFEGRYQVQGAGWSLLGDAAGLADPLTGEGIYYAARSAELLADGLAADRPEAYGAAVDDELRPELRKAFGIGQDYFRNRPLAMLIWGARHSPSVCAFLGDYLTGNATYQTARQRLKARRWAILGEVTRSFAPGGRGRRSGGAEPSKKAP